MHSSDVRKWIDSYERAHRKQNQGRRELDRLAMLSRDDDYEDDSGLSGECNGERPVWEEAAPARPAETATRLALLVGAGMIAALAIVFG